jgi:hypothetical protein
MKNIINIISEIYKAIDAKVIIILILAFFVWSKHNTNNQHQQQVQYVDTVIIYTDTLLDIPQQQQEKQLDTINLFKKYLWRKIKQTI